MKTLGAFSTHVYGVVIPVLILDALFLGVLADNPSGVAESGNPKLAVFIFFVCPVMNLYAILFSRKCASEADDDVERQYADRETTLNIPQNFRRRTIWSMSFLVGLLMTPPIFWLLTNGVEAFWGESGSFWSVSGHAASAITTLLVFVIVPKYFPGLLVFLDQIETRIGNKVSKMELP